MDQNINQPQTPPLGNPPTMPQAPQKKSSKKFIITVIALSVGIIAMGGFWFLSRKNLSATSLGNKVAIENAKNLPPQAAISACTGKVVGDVCQFTDKESLAQGICDDNHVKDVFDDSGRSGRTTERAELQRMLKALKENPVEAVIIYKIDRFARNVNDFSKMYNDFKEKGIKLLSINEGDLMEGNSLIPNIFASVAQ